LLFLAAVQRTDSTAAVFALHWRSASRTELMKSADFCQQNIDFLVVDVAG